MKKLLLPLLLLTGKAMAQMSQADMLVTGAGQPLYVSMDGIKNNKITYLRETAYVVDTTAHRADMKKIEKITVYNFAYFGATPLVVKVLAVLGTDTTKLVRNEAYGYDATNGLLTGYQSASNEGFEMGSVCQVERDANGVVIAKVSGYTFDLKQPAKPTNYKVQCSGGTGTNVQSVVFRYNNNGKDLMDRIHMDYDDHNRLVSADFYFAERNSAEKNTFTYNDKGKLTHTEWDYTHKTSEYKPATTGSAIFGVYVPGTKASVTEKTVTDINATDYEYDAQGKLTTVSYTNNNKLTSKEVFTYTTNGLPDTVSIYNDKGQLTGLRKFTCQ